MNPRIVLSDEILSSPIFRKDLPTMDYPRWIELKKGRHLGYARGITVSSWFVRLRLKERRYQQFRLGTPDDELKANGTDILTYKQAVAKALRWDTLRSGAPMEPVRAFERDDRYPILAATPPYTVAHAVVEYLRWYEPNRGSYPTTYYNCRAHILPALGHIPLKELDAHTIRKWVDDMADTPARLRSGQGEAINYRPKSNEPETIRQRRNTVNRALRNLKAILNRAYEYGYVDDPSPWQRIKPYRGVNKPRTRHLDLAQCRKLVEACPPALGRLVQGALLTGCRISELRRMLIEDVHLELKRIIIQNGKGSKVRHVSLSDEGVTFFSEIIYGKLPQNHVFIRENGSEWTTATHLRPFHNACVEIGIDPPLNFHALRHTYATQLAMAGVPFEVLAKQLGHKDTRMVQRHYAHLGSSYIDQVINERMPHIF